jgi:hypothetical protein
LGSQSYTTAYVVSNGHIDFDNPLDEFENSCLPVAGMDTAIFGHWDDLDLRIANCGADCGIYTAVLGSAPNRIFVVEWRAARYATQLKPVNFEILFYEGQANRFDIVYGVVTNAGNSATVGFQSGSFSCMFECNTGGLAQGMRLSYPPPVCGTPTNTPAVTATPTRTRTNTPVVSSTPISTFTATNTPTMTRTNTPVNSPTHTTTPCPSCPTNTPTNTPQGTATPCPMNFSDVNPSDFFYVPVRYLYCAGVISGYADGTFRPYNDTTRGQMTKIVVLAYGIAIYVPPTPTFTDVPPTDPFYQYIETAAYNEIVSGYADGTFRPYANVTRGQLSKIDVVAAGWPLINPTTPTFSDVPVENPFYTYIETAFCHGVITGYSDGTFRPFNNATRGQISKIVYESVINTVTCLR